MLGHLAIRKLGENNRVNLETTEGKPVVIHSFSDPEHGERIDVSRGSFSRGDLDVDRTVALNQVPGGHLPELHPIKTSSDAQAIIDDLRQATTPEFTTTTTKPESIPTTTMPEYEYPMTKPSTTEFLATTTTTTEAPTTTTPETTTTTEMPPTTTTTAPETTPPPTMPPHVQ